MRGLKANREKKQRLTTRVRATGSRQAGKVEITQNRITSKTLNTHEIHPVKCHDIQQ